MNPIERAGLAALRRVDPERAHDLALRALRLGVAPMSPPVTSPRLAVRLAGFDLANPVGLAAGFDKNAVALGGLLRAGFGFLEVGGVTPRAQSGNPRPRLFRLTEDEAVINRFGFNNEGAAVIGARLAQRPKGGIVGLNLGANKDSADRAGDFAAVLAACGPFLDFATVNVSSPNTEKLRDLQGPAALRALLSGVMTVRDGFGRPLPIFLKIAPDLEDAALEELAGVAIEAGVEAIIATNTTLSREGLRSADAHQTGGLSGKPLFERSTRVLARLSQIVDGAIPLIGVGGIDSGAAAYAKIRAGATAVQLYSALAYQGLSLVGRINRDLDALLARDGFAHVADAVGTGRSDWL